MYHVKTPHTVEFLELSSTVCCNLATRNGRQHAPQCWPRAFPPVLAKCKTLVRPHMRHGATAKLAQEIIMLFLFLTAWVSLGVGNGLWPKDAPGTETFSVTLGLAL